MKTEGKSRGKQPGRLLLILTFFLLAVFAAAAAAEVPGDLQADEVDLILARSTVKVMDLKGPDGETLQVRSGPSPEGRGAAGPHGETPDYVGMVGYAALPLDPEICRFPGIRDGYWSIPLYRRAKDGVQVIRDGQSISHKTPVIVTGQELEADGDGGFSGYLHIVRLDTHMPCMMDVSCFVTFPYWTLPIAESRNYGYRLAVYRETPGEAPCTEDGSGFGLRDGTTVLIPFAGAAAGSSPRPETLKIQGILFREDEPCILYFREEDLLPNY